MDMQKEWERCSRLRSQKTFVIKASYNVHVQSTFANNSCNLFNFVIDFFLYDPVLNIHNLISSTGHAIPYYRIILHLILNSFLNSNCKGKPIDFFSFQAVLKWSHFICKKSMEKPQENEIPDHFYRVITQKTPKNNYIHIPKGPSLTATTQNTSPS